MVTGEAYWLNIDTPTKKCTLHKAGCPYEVNKPEEKHGDWLSFPSLELAKAHKEIHYPAYELRQGCTCLS